MHLSRLFTVLRTWLDRRSSVARGPRLARHHAGVLAVAALLGPAALVSASILVTGNVTPADNPFTTTVNEGLPTDGNFVNPFEDPDHQTFFEGRHTDGSDPLDIADDTNENFNIFVGKKSFGTLLISGESALRDMNLVIGDSELVNNITRFGTGVVRITGFGSLYNNDFNIIPDGLPTNFASQSPRSGATAMDGLDGPEEGYDLYVGRAGTGTLEISAGARAEIQDAVIVANGTASTGHIIVDGLDSFLGSGGFTEGNLMSQAHAMLVGRQGVGYLTVTNGGTVRSDAYAGSTPTEGAVGAAIGSDPFNANQEDQPQPGGVGTATIDGTASKWIVGGSLQVGGFSAVKGSAPLNLFFDPTGTDLEYNNQAGRGTLLVKNGGLVDIVNAIQTGDQDRPNLALLIGQFGVVELDGGTINIGGATGQMDESRDRTVRIINDGILSGSGTITTGTFLNRYLGQVRVEGGQSLVIDSAADFTGAAASEPFPLTNYGRIEVVGTVEARAELEFKRFSTDPNGEDDPFYNLLLPADAPVVAPAFEGGQISAQHATLRFGSGIQNQGLMAFTAGNNVVSGQVVNFDNDAVVPDLGDSQILVTGPDTQVVFEDDLAIGAGTDLILSDGGKIVVLDQHSLAIAGNLGIELSYANPSLITVSGDVGIGSGIGGASSLSINLAGDVLQSLAHSDAFQIIQFGGAVGGVDVSNPTQPVVDLALAPLFTSIAISPDLAVLHPNLVAQVQFDPQGVYVAFLDPSLIGGGATGPDFNGDGVIDNADLAIWLTHVGIESGASVLDGDADGDGDVDGDDFLFWQRNVGQPMPWTGSGSAAAVPEPAAAVLLLVGLLAAPALRRRPTSFTTRDRA